MATNPDGSTELDWTDIMIHVALGLGWAVICALLHAPWAGFVMVLLFFPAREAWQAHQKYGAWLRPWQWTHQKLAEAFGPGAAALVVALIATLFA